MNTAYWHVYLTENQSTWAAIVLEQLGLMERSELLANLDAFKITAISRPHNVSMFTKIVAHHFPKAEIEWVDNPYDDDIDMLKSMDNLLISENHTLSKIYKDCLDNDQNVLYFHTKGITADLRFLENSLYPSDGDQYIKYYYWRQFLNWGVLRQWRCCLAALKDGASVVGPNFREYPEFHFSGGFWWSTSKHIRGLPDPTHIDWWQAMQAESDDVWFRQAPSRFKDEFWVTNAGLTEPIDLAPGFHNPADRFLSPKEYWSKGC